MAVQATITRRAALIGALTSSAALAVPAIAETGGEVDKLSPDLPEGHCQLTLAAKTYLIDTSRCPTPAIVHDEEPGFGHLRYRAWVPEAGALYAFITEEGELRVSKLSAGLQANAVRKRRLGFWRTSEDGSPVETCSRVTVLGRVTKCVVSQASRLSEQ